MILWPSVRLAAPESLLKSAKYSAGYMVSGLRLATGYKVSGLRLVTGYKVSCSVIIKTGPRFNHLTNNI